MVVVSIKVIVISADVIHGGWEFRFRKRLFLLCCVRRRRRMLDPFKLCMEELSLIIHLLTDRRAAALFLVNPRRIKEGENKRNDGFDWSVDWVLCLEMDGDGSFGYIKGAEVVWRP